MYARCKICAFNFMDPPEWPCKKSFGQAPTEDIVALACPTIVVEKKGHQKEDDQARTKKEDRREAKESAYRYVFVAAYRWRKKTGAVCSVIINETLMEKNGSRLVNAQEQQNSTC
jgi:hypothetical protein